MHFRRNRVDLLRRHFGKHPSPSGGGGVVRTLSKVLAIVETGVGRLGIDVCIVRRRRSDAHRPSALRKQSRDTRRADSACTRSVLLHPDALPHAALVIQLELVESRANRGRFQL